MTLSSQAVRSFRAAVYRYYEQYGRKDLPWRKTKNPYRILVSEIMLQQTQVVRVIEKYGEFLRAFPTVRALANAPLKNALMVWQGMGYNRRAIMLKRLAEIVVAEHNGNIPSDPETLRTLPGIGAYTMHSIAAFAFDMPVPVIETNIRAAIIHHFFKDGDNVSDTALLPVVERTLDRKHPALWYSALMDYGAHIKRAHKNPARRSAHYKKQSAFQGSDRQIRGMILRGLLSEGARTETALIRALGGDERRIKRIIEGLTREGFIEKKRTQYRIIER